MTPKNMFTRALAFLGFTQAQMAEALGMSRATYQRRERLVDADLPLAERTHVKGVVATCVLKVVFDEEDA